jgi:hypothetical protein
MYDNGTMTTSICSKLGKKLVVDRRPVMFTVSTVTGQTKGSELLTVKVQHEDSSLIRVQALSLPTLNQYYPETEVEVPLSL